MMTLLKEPSSRYMSVPLLAACLSALVAAWSPLAEAGTPTACISMPMDKFSEKAASMLNHLARENFTRAKEFELVDLRAFLNEGASDPRLAARAKALELLKNGKEQYDNLELDAAIEALEKAVEQFKKAAGRLGDGREYLETLLYLGAAYILSGDNEQGTEKFRTVAMFDKRKSLDAKAFPPSMIEIFGRVKEEVASAPTGTVLVKSTPPAAEVYLNGVFKGITPVTLVKIPEGSHFMRLEKDGFMPWGQMVDFYATHEETTEANLQPSPQASTFKGKLKALMTDLDEDPPEKGVLDFGAWARVEKILVVKVRQRGDEVSAEALLAQMEPPKKLQYRTATLNLTSSNFLARSDAFFSSMYRNVKLPKIESGNRKPGLAVGVARCNSDSDCTTGEVCDSSSGRCIPYAPPKAAFYEKWWFWAIVGGGLAVAGGTGALVWYLTRPDEGSIEFQF
jgi:tetratricopeptide (TPR) repeat protein